MSSTPDWRALLADDDPPHHAQCVDCGEIYTAETSYRADRRADRCCDVEYDTSPKSVLDEVRGMRHYQIFRERRIELECEDVLDVIREAGEPVPASMLCLETHLDRKVVHRRLGSLMDDGKVYKERSDDDRRVPLYGLGRGDEVDR